MKVRATAAAAILESPEILTQAYEDAMTKAAGAGERAVTTSMESIEKKSAVLKNNLSQLARDVIDSKMVKEIIDSLNELIKDIRQTGQDIAPVISGLMEILNIVTKIASIAPTGTLVGTLLAKNRVFGADNGLNKGIIKTLGLAQPTAAISQSELQIIKNAAADTNTYAEACGRLNDSMESLSPVAQEFVKTQIATNESSKAVIAACEKQAKVTRTLTIAQGLLNTALSIGISVIASLALRAISNWIHAEENARKETHELLSSLKASTEEYKKQEQAIADVIKKYKEYNGVLQDDKATESDLYTAKQNLYDLQEDINSQFNITAEGLDLVNGKYYEQLQLLSDIEDKSRNAYIAENAGAYQSAQEAINDRRYISELISSSSYNSGYRAKFFINFLEDLLKQYNTDFDTVNVQDFKDIIDTTIADFASGNRASAEALVKNAGLSEEYIDIYQEMLEDLSKTWGNIVNNAESSLNNALDAENLIVEYEKVLIADDPGFTALYNKLNDYLKQLNEAYVSGDYSEYQRLYEITKNYLEGASHIIPYDSIVNNIETQLDNINTAYEKQVAQELAEAQDIRERAENILNFKILGWNNGVQDANRQFTHMGYYGDPNYGAPLKWNEQEIKKAFEDLQVDTWEEINLFDDVIKEAVESGIHDINDLFDLYKKELKELNETKKEVFDYTNWLTFDSNLNKDKDNKYKNNELISAYQSAVAGFKEYLEQNEQGEIEINLGKIATYVGDTELFAQLGMESFDSYVKAFTDETGNVSKSDVLGTYIKDVFAKAIHSVSSSELTEEGYQLLAQAFDNINSEILGVSESVFKIEDSYWELRKLQTDVNNGIKFTQEEAVDLMNKYTDLYGSVESVTEEVNKETGELVKMYKFEEGSIDSLVGKYASLSNEAITSLKDQSKYFTETIKYLRQMQIELVQATVDAAMLRSGLTFNVDLKSLMNTDANQADISRAIAESIKGLDEDTQRSINKVISEGQQRVWNIMHGSDLELKVGDGTKTGNGKGSEESKANLDWLEQYLEKRNRLVEEKNKELDNLSKTDILAYDADAINKQLEKLQKGGNVNLKLRPEIDTDELNKKGWDAGEGFATVFTSTFSNDAGDLAINFTPIMVDPVTGKYLGVMAPDEFDQYCYDVIDGVRKDDLNLQIGAAFTGKDAIEQAGKAAMKIHKLHEQLSETSNNIELQYYNQRKAAREEYADSLEQQLYAYRVAEQEYANRMTSGVLYNDLVEAAGGKKAATALVNKIMAGESINLESMSSELSSAIGAMVDNWNNKRDAAEKQIEIGIQIKDNDLAQKKEDVERIVNKYDRVLKEFEQRKGTLEHYQTMQTTEGLMQNEKVIIAQINLETKALASNIAKRDQLTAELKSFIPTTEDELNHWYDLKGQIDETTSAIYANQEAIASWQNEVKKLEWDLDDKINQIRYKVTDEADFLINNLSSNDMYKYVREYLGNDAEKTKLYNGNLSDEGLATLAMHIVKRRSFYEEIKEYNKRIAEAEALYLQDSANVENLEHLDKLRSEQRQIIENYNDEKQAVVDLVKEGYDKQLESLDALINKYMEALTTEKDYSYIVRYEIISYSVFPLIAGTP